MNEHAMIRVILTGGGTGGHLYPGLAILNTLRNKISVEVLFIGTKTGLEAKIVPQLGIPFRTVWISGFRRKRIFPNLVFPVKMVVSWIQSIFLIRAFKPDVVIGTGGYVSWPVLQAGIVLGCYTVLQEQNEKPGLVTRMLASQVDAVYLSFESSTRYFRKKSNLYFTGNPTRPELAITRTVEAYRHFGLSPKRPTLFVFGGSQGAKSINQAMVSLIPTLLQETSAQILWATGPRGYEEIRKSIPENPRISIYPYITEMGLAYSVSDLVISRSGATTVAEITRVGLPAIFVPFPESAGGHQMANAIALMEKGAGILVPDGKDLADRLKPILVDLLNHPEKCKEMGRKAKALGRPTAGEILVEHLLEGLSRKRGEVW